MEATAKVSQAFPLMGHCLEDMGAAVCYIGTQQFDARHGCPAYFIIYILMLISFLV
jgi:hypothetical protein